MDAPRKMDDALLSAFHATCYHVSAPGAELQLRIGQYDAGLAKLLREAWVHSAALITAWNPGGSLHQKDWNEARQAALVRELMDRGHPCLVGRNVPDDDATPGKSWVEPSVLALDLTLGAARELATRYGQVAFLWIDRQATPQLVITAATSS